MMFKQLRKIHSLTLDTNVLLDLPEVPKYIELAHTEKGDQRYKRVMDSYMIAVLCLSDNINVKKIGMKIVEKEICKTKSLLPIFYQIFPDVVKPDRKAKKLAEVYMAKVNIDAPDALIVGTASANDVDILLTWNRHDLANENTQQEIQKINTAAGVHTPVVCDPTHFIDRLIGSAGKAKISLAFSFSPVPKAYRLNFFPSR